MINYNYILYMFIVLHIMMAEHKTRRHTSVHKQTNTLTDMLSSLLIIPIISNFTTSLLK